jgi:DNA polymerase I
VFQSFSEIVVLDTEFHTAQVVGNRPVPVCLCALELRSRREHRIWFEPGAALINPLPPEALYVAYTASAEWGCYLALGWDLPRYICDLFFEFRCLTNGRHKSVGNSLVDALTYYGCPAMPKQHKQGMRELILEGRPFDSNEREEILDYCWEDVDSTIALLEAMAGDVNLPAALERGRYSKAIARMEWSGIPVDVPLLRSMQQHSPEIRSELVVAVEREHQFNVYRRNKTGFSFSNKAFDDFLVREGLDQIWLRTPSGRPYLKDEYLKEMAQVFPQLSPLRELRKTLSCLKDLDPPVGTDGRNRTSIRPFAAKTSRNQPRIREMVMCFPAWARSLMRAEPGHALLYVDLSSAEFGIAAALSHDPAMMEDYRQGDPYLATGKRLGKLPSDATKESHRQEREDLKSVCVGPLYGMGAGTLALKLQVSIEEAKDLLRLHRRAYPRYWQYIDEVVEVAKFEHQVWTALDWRLNDAHREKTNSVRNFPMQATCAEILRLACCLTTESGLEVIAPFHDALLVHVPIEKVDESLNFVGQCWTRASAAILDGFELRSDARRDKAVFEFPDRYMDGRHKDFFAKVVSFLEERGYDLG